VVKKTFKSNAVTGSARVDARGASELGRWELLSFRVPARKDAPLRVR
jgi:hypothetical protein